MGSKLLALLALSPLSAFAFDVSFDLLVWKASEETSLLWANSLRTGPGNTEIFEAHDLSFDWDVGFRVGLGYVLARDCWDLRANWTHFHSQGDDCIPNDGRFIETELFGGFIHQDISESAKINIKLKYNMFDVQLGRDFCITDCLSLRPFMGIKGGWIDQSIGSKWESFTLEPLVAFSSTENLTNDFWGVGPVGGIESQWNLTYGFHFFGDFETALLWGTWKNTDVYQNSLSEVINTNLKTSHLGELMLRGFVGIGWETEVCDWAHFAVKLGYEGQIWFSQLRIPTFQQLVLHGDLTLQGGTLNLSLEF